MLTKIFLLTLCVLTLIVTLSFTLVVEALCVFCVVTRFTHFCCEIFPE